MDIISVKTNHSIHMMFGWSRCYAHISLCIQNFCIFFIYNFEYKLSIFLFHLTSHFTSHQRQKYSFPESVREETIFLKAWSPEMLV